MNWRHSFKSACDSWYLHVFFYSSNSILIHSQVKVFPSEFLWMVDFIWAKIHISYRIKLIMLWKRQLDSTAISQLFMLRCNKLFIVVKYLGKVAVKAFRIAVECMSMPQYPSTCEMKNVENSVKHIRCNFWIQNTIYSLEYSKN